MTVPEPPETYKEFIQRYPNLGKAWELAAEEGTKGPLDPKTIRLVKLGIAMGAMREGAVHAGIRKALAMGASKEELDQIVALLAGTLGFPSTVAVYSWVRDELRQGKEK